MTRSELAQLAEERFSRIEARGVESKTQGEAERTVALIPETPEPPDRGEAYAVIRSLADASEIQLAASQGLEQFRGALIRNPVLVRPLFCVLFPTLVTTQLVATATTDDCGHFSAVFWRGCSSDTPDLYFVAYRRVFTFRSRSTGRSRSRVTPTGITHAGPRSRSTRRARSLTRARPADRS